MSDVDSVGPAITDTLVEKLEAVDLESKVEPPPSIQWRPLTSLKKKVDVREPITPEECKERLSKFVEKKGLKKFYPEITPALSQQAAKLVNELYEVKKCDSREMANQFAFLTLYDLAILIGMSFSGSS